MLLRPDAEMRRIPVMRHVHPIAVIGRGAPIPGDAAAQHLTEAPALHIVRRLHPSQGEDRRREVRVVHQLIVAAAGLDHRWIAHQERHSHRLLVHPALVDIVVLAKHEALVASVDDHRLVHQPLGFEVPEQPPDIVIHSLDTAQVALEVALVRELRVFPVAKRLVDLHVLSHIALDVPLGNAGANFT